MSTAEDPLTPVRDTERSRIWIPSNPLPNGVFCYPACNQCRVHVFEIVKVVQPESGNGMFVPCHDLPILIEKSEPMWARLGGMLQNRLEPLSGHRSQPSHLSNVPN